jgi:hypothetical protein
MTTDHQVAATHSSPIHFNFQLHRRISRLRIMSLVEVFGIIVVADTFGFIVFEQ